MTSGGAIDDDSFLDWETRHESIPLHKHIVAGKYMEFPCFKESEMLITI